VRFESRLRRLEGHLPTSPALAVLEEWPRTLELDVLRCIVAVCGPDELVGRLPAGIAFEEAKVRVQALLLSAPEQVRVALEGQNS
jgi:hypothetical protein